MSWWLILLLSLLLTIPVNIASQYLMGPFQRWLDASRANLSGRRKRQLQDELWRIKLYRDDPAQLHTYLLRTIVFILRGFLACVVYFTAVALIFGSFALVALAPDVIGVNIGHASKSTITFLSALLLFMTVIQMLNLTLVSQAMFRALSTVVRVRTFERFQAKTLELLREGRLPEKSDGTNHEP